MGNKPTSSGGDTDDCLTKSIKPINNPSTNNYPTITLGHSHQSTSTITLLILSDTHGKHRTLPLPSQGADILLHCGDWSNWKTSKKDTVDFNKWLGELKGYERKILICGNHEICCGKLTTAKIKEKYITNAEYYCNEAIQHKSLKLWLSPLTRARNVSYRANSFSKSQERLQEEFSKCPNDTDVLITHSPPYGILDRHKKGHRMGSIELWKTVQRVLPSIHIFGHCHDDAGALSRKMLPEGTWHCQTCTFENQSLHLACSACSTVRQPKLITFINASNKKNVQPFLLKIYMKKDKINDEEEKEKENEKEEEMEGKNGGGGIDSEGNDGKTEDTKEILETATAIHSTQETKNQTSPLPQHDSI